MLINIFEWMHEHTEKVNQPWLVLGKGQSFVKRSEYDLQAYEVLTLNDAIREVSAVTVAHFIDIDAFERNADYAIKHATVTVLPWFPHVNNKPSKQTLSDYVLQNSTLRQLDNEGRLLWYDLSTSKKRYGSHHVVLSCFFSAEAALDILAFAGVNKIRSLGIDGGTSYSHEFDDLSSVTRLNNGQSSFDLQFTNFAKVIANTGVDYSPLDLESPIRVFVAATEREWLPVKVLEYSIKQHTSVSVMVSSLANAGMKIKSPLDIKNRARTPFSFQRFLIPKLANFEGKAIYLDSDMLVFKDLRKLWEQPFGKAEVLAAYSEISSGRTPQFSVMLLNCARLRWSVDEIVLMLDTGKLSYEQLMYECSLAKTKLSIEPKWNSLESYQADNTALLHYTDMNTQPWVSSLNPLGYLWVRALREAISAGDIPRELLVSEVRKGHIRPSLIYQVDQGIDDSFLLPKNIRKLDDDFVAPFREIQGLYNTPWRHRMLRLKALIRTYYQNTSIFRLERRLRRRFSIE